MANPEPGSSKKEGPYKALTALLEVTTADPKIQKEEFELIKTAIVEDKIATGGFSITPSTTLVTATRKWDPSLIAEAVMYMPELVIGDTHYKYPYPEISDNADAAENPNAIALPPSWQYYNWGRLVSIAQGGSYQKVRELIPYFCALHAVTPLNGTPIVAPFIRYVKKIHYIQAPSEPYNPPEHEKAKFSATGYGLWLMLVRYGLKSNQQVDIPEAVLGNLAKFLPDFDGILFSGLFAALLPHFRAAFYSGSRCCQSETLIRHGMNIRALHGLQLEENGNFKYLILEQGQNGKEYKESKTLKSEDTPTGKRAQLEKYYLETTSIPNYNANFWSYAQVGIEKHGYSAMEQLRVSLEKYKKSIMDIVKEFRTPDVLLFAKEYLLEEALCRKDPWRSVGQLLVNGIESTMSSSKHPKISYIGTCFNAQSLDYHHPPDAMPGINITRSAQVYLAKSVQWLRDHWMLHGDERVKGLDEAFGSSALEKEQAKWKDQEDSDDNDDDNQPPPLFQAQGAKEVAQALTQKASEPRKITPAAILDQLSQKQLEPL